MTTSFPTSFALPPLQLLVLVLVLLAGLLPNNSIAQDEAGAVATADPASTVKCYVTYCDNLLDGLPRSLESCLKAAEPNATIQDCPTGFCYQYSYYITQWKGTTSQGRIIRRCADLGELTCLQKEPGSCMKLNFTLGWKRNDEADREKYMKYREKCETGPTTPSPGRSAAEDKTGDKEMQASKTTGYCVCKGDLCNGPPILTAPTKLTEPKSTGVKHLGCNVALVEALLVGVFPLRTMFLVG